MMMMMMMMMSNVNDYSFQLSQVASYDGYSFLAAYHCLTCICICCVLTW